LTHNDGILQDLPSSSHDMRMDNDLWPVVRESARRILRLEKILFKTPSKYLEDFRNLCEKISDKIPSRLVFPDIEIIETNDIEVYHRNNNTGRFDNIIHIGKSEPDIDVCWIEFDLDQGWKWLMETCFELLDAGYPGCIGCGGPNSERNWDEEKFRESRISNK